MAAPMQRVLDLGRSQQRTVSALDGPGEHSQKLTAAGIFHRPLPSLRVPDMAPQLARVCFLIARQEATPCTWPRDDVASVTRPSRQALGSGGPLGMDPVTTCRSRGKHGRRCWAWDSVFRLSTVRPAPLVDTRRHQTRHGAQHLGMAVGGPALPGSGRAGVGGAMPLLHVDRFMGYGRLPSSPCFSDGRITITTTALPSVANAGKAHSTMLAS